MTSASKPFQQELALPGQTSLCSDRVKHRMPELVDVISGGEGGGE